MAQPQEVLEFQCSNCGAALQVTPETILGICAYCGYPMAVPGFVSLEKMYVVPSKPRETVLDAFRKRLETDVDLREIRRQVEVFQVEGSYYPFWTAEVSLSGYAAYIRVERHGMGKHARTVRKRVEEDFNRRVPMSFTARRQVLGFGFRDVLAHYDASAPPLEGLKQVGREEWKQIRLTVLAPEFDEVEAMNKVAEDTKDVVRGEYKGKGDELEFFTAEVSQVANLRLVLLPVWTVTYAFKGSLFQVLHSGWDGVPVAATEPVLMLRRATYVLGSILASLLGGFAAVLLANRNFQPGLILLGVAAVAGFILGHRLTRGVRVEGVQRSWL